MCLEEADGICPGAPAQRPTAWVGTTMSRPLPPEILDLIVDHIHDEPTALRAQLETCCLVSKSWVPRTRKHLFAHVAFRSNSSIELWKKAFPDHSNSPAHHTHSLSILDPSVVTVTSADIGDLIRTFRNVVHLQFTCMDRAALVPFYGLSPGVRSLHVAFSTTEVSDLVCSFPLLEDLKLDFPDPEGDQDGWNAPLTSPKLTGSLTLWSFGKAHFVIRQLLDLPGGFHFSKISVLFHNEEVDLVADLVSKCFDTLENLTIGHYRSGASPSAPLPTSTSLPLAGVDISNTAALDLSKATKLKRLTFLWGWLGPTIGWITVTLQTVNFKTLESITIKPGGETTTHQEWQDLDRLLVWTSCSVYLRVVYAAGKEGEEFRDKVPSLLPELTRRGLIDLVEAEHAV